MEEFAQALAHSSTRALAARASGGGASGGGGNGGGGNGVNDGGGALSTPMYIVDEFKRGGGGGGDVGGGFCGSLPFTHRYSDLVADVCHGTA